MKTMHLSLMAVAGATFIASMASADFVSVEAVNVNTTIDAINGGQQNVPAGHNVWRIYANFNDPLDSFLNVTVEWNFSGALYQNPFGGNGPPNPAFYAIDPLIAADSYVTVGVSEAPGGVSDTGFDPDFLANGFSASGVLGGWFDSNPVSPTNPDANGQVLIAQLTLPTSVGGIAGVEGGPGTIFYEDAQNPGTATPGEFVLNIPGPGALALLGLAGLAGRRRRA